MDRETKKLLEEILASIKNLDTRVSRLEADASRDGAEPLPTSAQKKLSLKEFLIDRGPSNAVQMSLAIGYFLENYDSLSSFNAADLERGFRAARETVPPNINDKANMCVRNGHFMEHNEKKDNMKAWVVTRTGEEVVRAGFGNARS
jgi:hypothetical protein